MTPAFIPTIHFPDALRAWTGKPLDSLPPHQPPCGHIPGAPVENAALADAFSRLCALPTTTERVGYLMAVIERYRRHIRLAEATIRGEANPRRVGAEASREAWARLRPMEAMIDALELWRDQLLDLWDGEIGVSAIDQAVH